MPLAVGGRRRRRVRPPSLLFVLLFALLFPSLMLPAVGADAPPYGRMGVPAAGGFVDGASACAWTARGEARAAFGKAEEAPKDRLYDPNACEFVQKRYAKCVPRDAAGAKARKNGPPPKAGFRVAYPQCPGGEAPWDRRSLFKKLFKKLSGRTLYFVGDSIMENLFSSVACSLGAVKPGMKQAKEVAPGVSASIRKRCAKWPKENHTRVCLVRRGREGIVNADGDVDLGPVHHLKPDDVVVMNLGVHYNRDDAADLKKHAKLIAKLVADKELFPPRELVWRETTAQHFHTPDGSFESTKNAHQFRSKPCAATTALPAANATKHASWRDDISAPILEPVSTLTLRLGMLSATVPPILHRGGADCTHYCGTFVPDVYAEFLAALLLRGGS